MRSLNEALERITWNPVARSNFDRLKIILNEEVFLGALMVVKGQPNENPGTCVEACLTILADLHQLRLNTN